MRANGSLYPCEKCGIDVYRTPSQVRNGEGRYCSNKCRYDAKRGVEITSGTRYVNSQGYVVVKVGIRKWQLEHRLVAERMLGRELTSAEHVHHLNEVKHDNRSENLQVLTNTEHQHVHQHPQTRPRRIEKTCCVCGKTYAVKASKAAESKSCSNACRLTALHASNRNT